MYIDMYMNKSIWHTASLSTKILDFIGFDSSIILNLRGGIPRPIGNFPESLSQAILVGRFLVWRLGVQVVVAGVVAIKAFL